MNKLIRGTTMAVAAVGASAVVAFAAVTAGHSLFGNAEYVSPGNASTRAVEVDEAAPGYGGVDFAVNAGTTFGDLTTLATDYKFEAPDTCGLGSPRFSVSVEDPNSSDTGNIFVYLGDAPGYNTCPTGVWTDSGDLLETGKSVDTSQLDLGTFYDPYDTALLKYSGYVVTGIALVVDADQTVQFDNTDINEVTYTYEPELTNAELKEQCKKGGYATMTDPRTGSPFKNQGQCVSYYAKPQPESGS